MKDIDWKKVQEFYDLGHTWKDLEKEFGLYPIAIQKGVKNRLLKIRSKEESQKLRLLKPAPKHSEETKIKLSNMRKEFLKNNPQKHSWRNPNKKKSVPCESVKEYLKSLNINFIEEFQPEIEGRFFSIDIALPDKMIALEINGQHHYESNGDLKPYYQERHNLLEKAGWKVFEIHYSSCFKFEKWQEFIEMLKNSPEINEFDYFNFIPKNTKPNWTLCSCNQKLKRKTAKLCQECSRIKSRKVLWPSKEELEKLIQEIPMTRIGKMYDVSDNAVRKWCKSYEISLKK